MIYIKLKSNYIMPCYINLKVLQSMDESVQVVAQFRLQKLFKPSAYFILDSGCIIDSISPGCIALLNLDSKAIFHKKTCISELFPNFDQDREQYIGKVGCPISYLKMAANNTEVNQSGSNAPNQEDMKEESIQYQCTLTEIYLEFHDHNLGYIMKLENLSAGGDHSKSEILVLPPPPLKPCAFQLKMNPLKLYFMGEFVAGDANSFRVDQSILWE